MRLLSFLRRRPTPAAPTVPHQGRVCTVTCDTTDNTHDGQIFTTRDYRLPAVSIQSVRQALNCQPEWLIQECLTWTRAEEARGHQFTSGRAAVTHWLQAVDRGRA